MLNRQSLVSLLSPWVDLAQEPLNNIQVANLELDSRKVAPGDTFVAVIGHAVDGRKFISAAIEKGATSVIAHACPEHPHGSLVMQDGCPVIYLRQLDQNLSALSARLYSFDSALVAVTGTNGKTTISQLIAQWLGLLGRKAAVMGTTGNGFLDELRQSTNTTGSAIEIRKTLAELSDQGAEYTALEVSSHGLVQGRVRSLEFQAGIFTNLSRDHLDYHGTMREYAQAKMMLFTEHKCANAIINADDNVGSRWLGQLPEAIAVSLEGNPGNARALWAKRVDYSDSGISLSFSGCWGEGELRVPLIGAFNASNVMLALAALLSMGFDKDSLLESAPKLQPVIGRMELFQQPGKAKIVVDYAHTPDALEKALSALRVHCNGKLWAIFGCGGDRDTGKRPMMAEIAERLADKVVLTDDNPRSEDPATIFQHMLAGMDKPARAITRHDRYQALSYVFEHASDGDIILLAGKGHEDYQVLRDSTIHYSDRESAQKILGVTQ